VGRAIQDALADVRRTYGIEAQFRFGN
jgi:hypothetical protein